MSAAIQTVWADLIARTLADAGVTTAVVSPGSRSTPLVCALSAAGQLALPTLIDERAAGFFALGLARSTGEPVALVCTSGTAAAHYLPAVIEASQAGVPLIVVTADRPPELHGCGAPQTIDQVKLYGGFARAYVDVGAPDGGALALRALRRKIAQAVATARGPEAGPVHVEVPLRKPLEPRPPATAAEHDAAATARALLAEPLVLAPPPRLRADDGAVAALAALIGARRRGVIVAGPVPPAHAETTREALLALAARSGYVLLAEAGSQARLTPRPGVIACDSFDLALACDAAAMAPDVIVQIGGEPAALGWPAIRDAWRGAARWVVPGTAWSDPDSSADGLVRGDLGDALARIADAVAPGADAAWQAAWADLDAIATVAAEAHLGGAESPPRETAVVRAVVAALARIPGAALMVGNSLPVRALDDACPGGGPAIAVVTQRGANGIDGLVAGAAGAAFGGRPTVLIVGDVSFAHDVGGLAAVRLARAPLAIVVVDNGGGRIFAGLPVAGEALPAGALERHWLTPPGVDPVAAAAAFGVAAQTVRTPDEAAAAIRAALSGAGSIVLHAPVAADGHAAFRRDALDQVSRRRAESPATARTAEGARR